MIYELFYINHQAIFYSLKETAVTAAVWTPIIQRASIVAIGPAVSTTLIISWRPIFQSKMLVLFRKRISSFIFSTSILFFFSLYTKLDPPIQNSSSSKKTNSYREIDQYLPKYHLLFSSFKCRIKVFLSKPFAWLFLFSQ